MLVRALVLFGLFAFAGAADASAASEPVMLWPDGVPGPKVADTVETVRISPQGDHVIAAIRHPSLTPYLPDPDKATGAAIVVMPGGGHRELWIDHEGYRVADWLSAHGIAAFVLKYRLAKEPDSRYTIDGDELADAQRAIRLVRYRAKEWHVDPSRVGVIGFSAGGELAALAGTHFDTANPKAHDEIDRENDKPDFMALIYPGGKRQWRLSSATPPAFLMVGDNDGLAPGVAELYLAMKRAGVPAELHILTNVGHGFGIRDTNPPPVAGWTMRLYEWMGARGLLAHGSTSSP